MPTSSVSTPNISMPNMPTSKLGIFLADDYGVARGYTNKQFAERWHISVKTVEGHKARIMDKLDLHSRAEIVRHALQKGWLQDG